MTSRASLLALLFLSPGCPSPQELGYNLPREGGSGSSDATADASDDPDASDARRDCSDDCDDRDPCTADSCEAGECLHRTVDVDRDDHGPAFVGTTRCRQGDDCDDFDGHSFPGAPEACDYIDNDCDGLIDEGLPYAEQPPDTMVIPVESLTSIQSLTFGGGYYAATWQVGLGDPADVIWAQVFNPTAERFPPASFTAFQSSDWNTVRWTGDGFVILGMTRSYDCAPSGCTTYLVPLSASGGLDATPRALFDDATWIGGQAVADGELYVASTSPGPPIVRVRSFRPNGDPGRADTILLELSEGERLGRMAATPGPSEIAWVVHRADGTLTLYLTDLEVRRLADPRLLARGVAHLFGADDSVAVSLGGTLFVPYADASGSLTVGRWSASGDDLGSVWLADGDILQVGLSADEGQVHGCFVSGAPPFDLYYFRLAPGGVLLQPPAPMLTSLPSRGECLVASNGRDSTVVAAHDYGEFDYPAHRVARTGTVAWTRMACD